MEVEPGYLLHKPGQWGIVPVTELEKLSAVRRCMYDCPGSASEKIFTSF